MASCKWSCQRGDFRRCYGHDDCVHRENMRNAPEWLIKLIRAWGIAVGSPSVPYGVGEKDIYDLPRVNAKPPLRQKFYINQHFGLVVYDPDCEVK